MITEDWVKDKLKSKIVGFDIVLEEWVDKNKAFNKITIPVKEFTVMFAGGLVDDDGKRGYKKYFDAWQKEGLI